MRGQRRNGKPDIAVTAFNDTVVQNFWIWGNLFHPIRSYSQIYNDHLLIKNTLRTTYAE